jgi:thiamine pyrophosphokinase
VIEADFSPPVGRRVLGVLDGGDIDPAILGAWARSADVVLAADGAADRLIECGVTPHVTVGDMDSLTAPWRLPHIVEDRNQAASDADKVLEFARASDYDQVTLIGVEGDRLDHVLASLASAARSPLNLRFVLRSGLAWMLNSGRSVEISTVPNDLVSLIPIESCSGVDFSGVLWPLSDAVLAPTGLVSLSNRAVGEAVHATVRTGAALLVRVCGRPPEPAW